MAKTDDIDNVYPRKLWKIVGESHFGTVYKAFNKSGGIVTIKKFSKENKDARLDFEIETYVYKKTTAHPNIPKLYNAFDNVDAFYAVFEFYEEGEFEGIFEYKPDYNEEDVRDVVVQVAAGLSHCLDVGIVHREVSFENILARTWDPVYVA